MVERYPRDMRARRSVWVQWIEFEEWSVPPVLRRSIVIEDRVVEPRSAQPALPMPSAEPTTPPRKPERRYWEPLRNLAFDWMDKNGVPVLGDGRQAELVRNIQDEINQLSKPRPRPVLSTIKRHVAEWIKQYQVEHLPDDKVTTSSN